MKITRDNYEPFFLDFLEGNLEEERMDQFLDFLIQNPELKEELKLTGNLSLPVNKIIFTEKKKLYRVEANGLSITEHQSVAYLENDLDAELRKTYEAELYTHPELKKDNQFFAKTVLIPDPEIKFPHKHKLYRKSASARFLNWGVRIAAVAILFWGIYPLLQNKNQVELLKSNPEIAEIKRAPETSERKSEPEKNTPEAKLQELPESNRTEQMPKHDTFREEMKKQGNGQSPANSNPIARDLTKLAKITPKSALLDIKQAEIQLAISPTVPLETNADQRKIMSLDEFLANRIKKTGDEGLLSAHRIVRAGLNVASELSGERIGYRVKEGQITSLDFESKFLAFSIPLKKE